MTQFHLEMGFLVFYSKESIEKSESYLYIYLSIYYLDHV